LESYLDKTDNHAENDFVDDSKCDTFFVHIISVFGQKTDSLILRLTFRVYSCAKTWPQPIQRR